ncbi:MAG: hypothetical protein JW832_03605, partial [Deltaproteobacteria bacterium]|nr:hypothetical protein [Deltaproteobacteria bacterium]
MFVNFIASSVFLSSGMPEDQQENTAEAMLPGRLQWWQVVSFNGAVPQIRDFATRSQALGNLPRQAF